MRLRYKQDRWRWRWRRYGSIDIVMAYVCHEGKQFGVNCIVVSGHMRWARQKEGTRAAVWIKMVLTYHGTILETVV